MSVTDWRSMLTFRKDHSDMMTGEDTAVSTGAAIRRARKDAGLTQMQLSELAGLSDRTVRQIENGSGSPSFRAVLAVLSVLGLTLTVST